MNCIFNIKRGTTSISSDSMVKAKFCPCSCVGCTVHKPRGMAACEGKLAQSEGLA